MKKALSLAIIERQKEFLQRSVPFDSDYTLESYFYSREKHRLNYWRSLEDIKRSVRDGFLARESRDVGIEIIENHDGWYVILLLANETELEKNQKHFVACLAS